MGQDRLAVSTVAKPRMLTGSFKEKRGGHGAMLKGKGMKLAWNFQTSYFHGLKLRFNPMFLCQVGGSKMFTEGGKLKAKPSRVDKAGVH